MSETVLDAIRKALVAGGPLYGHLEDTAVGIIRKGSDEGLTPVGFVLKMATFLMEKSNLSFSEAKRQAGIAYRDFLRDNRLKFGEPGWDWSGRGARDVATEYVVNYWEQNSA